MCFEGSLWDCRKVGRNHLIKRDRLEKSFVLFLCTADSKGIVLVERSEEGGSGRVMLDSCEGAGNEVFGSSGDAHSGGEGLL